MFSLGRLCKADAISARIPGSISCPLPINQLDRNANNLLCGSTLWRLLVFSLDLIDEKTLKVSISLIDLLHLHEHRCLHIRQPNGDGLQPLTAGKTYKQVGFGLGATLTARGGATIFATNTLR